MAQAFSPCSLSDKYNENYGRVVLHVDLNNFFASVECANSEDKEINSKPLAVCGDQSKRHGIILAKNEKAKLYGVKTGETIVEARKKCPTLITAPAHYSLYMRYSRAARQIYLRYTDRVEPFGMDEAWLELTGNKGIFGIDDGKLVADEIRRTLKTELGITASVGVADNKVFAKLGSDYKKPDATTVFSPDEYSKLLYPMAVSEILYVGKSTCATLRSFGISTVGDVVTRSPSFFKNILGKNGVSLYNSCCGRDISPVAFFEDREQVKSVSNSTTPPKDITDFFDAKLILSSLCDNVSSRLRKDKLKCSTVKVSFRDTNLNWFERQVHTEAPTSSARDLLKLACSLLYQTVDLSKTPLRGIGVCGTELSNAEREPQISLFPDKSIKKDIIDSTIDSIRKRFGACSVVAAFDLCDKEKLGHIEHGYEVFTSPR